MWAIHPQKLINIVGFGRLKKNIPEKRNRNGGRKGGTEGGKEGRR